MVNFKKVNLPKSQPLHKMLQLVLLACWPFGSTPCVEKACTEPCTLAWVMQFLYKCSNRQNLSQAYFRLGLSTFVAKALDKASLRARSPLRLLHNNQARQDLESGRNGQLPKSLLTKVSTWQKSQLTKNINKSIWVILCMSWLFGNLTISLSIILL